MGSKQRRKTRGFKKKYKQRGHNLHKSVLSSTLEKNGKYCIDAQQQLDVNKKNEVDKEIRTLDVVRDKSNVKDNDCSNCIENEAHKEIRTPDVVCDKSNMNDINCLDRIENELDVINLEIRTQDVCNKNNVNVVDSSERIQNELDVTNKEIRTQEAYEYEIEQNSPSRPPYLEGRRIVNMMNLYSKLQDVSTHGPFNCNLKCVDIISEKQNGLQSTFTLRCKLCHAKFIISSDEGSEMDINNCAVLGAVSIGCGYSQLQEFSGALDLPLMGEKVYQKSHETIADMWEDISVEAMNDAAKKERELAILEGRIDENGVPNIDVIVDGCWSKRTYKKNYSALSGAAAIIGKNTGQILYLGIKNKYCCICAQAQYKKETPRNHKCFKNYSGPSTGMESNILVEGFKCSIKMHGLIYGRMISDGDSSTYSKIIEARPYLNVTVQKIECKNHIMRNMCNKLAQLKTDTKYPPRFRKNITDQKIISIRVTMKKAIEEHTSVSESEKRAHVELLYNDILLAHVHAFGDHSRCKTYFCKKTNEEDNSDHDFMTSSLWSKICQIMSNVASYAPSLVHNVESNKAENFNSIIAKLVGGKRINYSLRGAYENRCRGAAISHNTRALLSKTYKHATGNSPTGKMKLLEERRRKRRRLIKKNIRKKNRFLFSKGEDINYGENCTREDIDPEIMEKEKATFINNLRKNEDEREKIEKETILQSASSDWLELRRKLLTASNFGRVIKRRSDISCSKLVKDLLYKDCISHIKSIKHGVDNEKIAMEQLSKQEGIKIQPCGLFLDEKLPYLGASPDGIWEDMTVEIKCPISAYQLNFDEVLRKKKVPFFKLNQNGDIKINTKHNWYYQIQGQLHVTKKSKCLFGLWLGENFPMRTEIIQKDDKFWNEEMENKLTRFYLDCILPELIDPRHTRNMAIRDPTYIQEAVEKKAKRKNKIHNVSVKKKKETGKKKEDEDKNRSISDFPINYNKKVKEHEELKNHNTKSRKRKQTENVSKINEEEKEIMFNYSKKFPNVLIQEFGEISDDDILDIQQNNEKEQKETKNVIAENTKRNISEYSTDWPNVFMNDDEEVIKRRKILSERQLNFNEF